MIDAILEVLGPVLIIGTTIIGVRLLAYWRSFIFHWPRYRQRQDVSTADLLTMDVPFVKIQVTTRGSPGSTEVILRGIRNIMTLAQEHPRFYGRVLSVEVVTESEPQARLIERMFAGQPVVVQALLLPADYQTPYGTMLKARGLHYAVEWRRAGWNSKPGRTFIVHYDEESVMVPDELRKLLRMLSVTDKKILEGPIYYPLEYADASAMRLIHGLRR